MNYTEHEYIQAGYMYEKAKTGDQTRARAEVLRLMLESERIDDRAHARYLVEQGRKDAR